MRKAAIGFCRLRRSSHLSVTVSKPRNVRPNTRAIENREIILCANRNEFTPDDVSAGC